MSENIVQPNEVLGEVFPEAKYQHCIVLFYRNAFSVTPRSRVKPATGILRAVHAQESRRAAREDVSVAGRLHL